MITIKHGDMISWVDSWQLRNKKDVHPSHATAVIEVDDLIADMGGWLEANDFAELKQCVSDFINDLQEVVRWKR